MHHGVKGQRWGVRRYQSYDVTGPRKGGKTGTEVGDAKSQDRRLYKESKKVSRVLTKIDKASGKDVAEQFRIHEKSRALNKKIKKLESKAEYKGSKSSVKKLNKALNKQTKYKDIMNSYSERIKESENLCKRILKDSESSGLKFTAKGVLRSANPKAQKRLNAGALALETIMSGLTGRSIGVYANYEVSGLKYKADKTLKGSHNRNGYSEATSSNRPSSRYVKKTTYGHVRY